MNGQMGLTLAKGKPDKAAPLDSSKCPEIGPEKQFFELDRNDN